MSSFDSQPPDGTLLAGIQAGDDACFTELVRRYRGPLTRVARSRLGRDDWADDVVQETFLCVARWLSTYDSRYSFRTWLWTILLNQCHRQLKRASRQYFWNWTGWLGESARRQAASGETPEQRLLAKERAELLDQLLRRLPEPQADALRLRFFADLTFPEIARAMNCSLSTAKNRVRWGLLKLAESIGPAGEYASWASALGDLGHEERNGL